MKLLVQFCSLLWHSFNNGEADNHISGNLYKQTFVLADICIGGHLYKQTIVYSKQDGILNWLIKWHEIGSYFWYTIVRLYECPLIWMSAYTNVRLYKCLLIWMSPYTIVRLTLTTCGRWTSQQTLFTFCRILSTSIKVYAWVHSKICFKWEGVRLKLKIGLFKTQNASRLYLFHYQSF